MESLTVEFYKHNQWANLRVIDLCAGLSDELLDATGGGVYGSVRDTLVHLVGAQTRYVSRLLDRPRDDTVSERAGFPGFEVLREVAERSGEALISVARDFDSSVVLTGTWGGKPYEMPAIVPMMQAINHATEHRAHIMTVLTQHGVQPLDLDVWAYGDAVQEGAKSA